ncbi:hypothetical protein [Microbacterium panaciterrae]|uniref:DUF5134 domain-containing protein n=1 Tax=Microbacterium panaciterrae TaxID=985759 RepID=A0ABP8P2A8_9MICO
MLVFHEVAMGLMIGSAIAAALCCLGAAGLSAGRAVPWQSGQAAIVMALGMVALCADRSDAGVALLVSAVGLGSAMVGAIGVRGRSHAGACFHRALGCVAMALCAMAMLGAQVSRGPLGRTGAAAAGHAGHGSVVPLGVLAAAGVGLVLVLMLVDRVRHRPAARGGTRVLLAAEGGAMALSLAVMGAMAVAGL